MIEENRAWFFDEDPKFYTRVYVMYDRANPALISTFKQGKPQDLSGFRYELSKKYDARKRNKDYLYKSGDDIVKFHKANTDDHDDKELTTWNITSHVLGAIEKKHSSIVLPRSFLYRESYLLHNSSFEDEVKTIVFNVEKTKKATLEYLLEWDFLPNSTGNVLLANDKALKVLNEVAKDDIQAFPAEIRMYDNGPGLKNYHLINITTRKDVLNKEKSILHPEEQRKEWDMYEKKYYDKDCMGNHAFLLADSGVVFLASERVRRAVKEANLTGLVFKNSHGINYIE